MAFRNNSTNKKSTNTNTKIVQLYNSNAGADSSTLSLGYWNTYVSVNINPMLPKEQQVDGKLYNYEQSAGIILSMENIVQLNTGIRLLEASLKDNKGKVTNIAVSGGSNTILKIGAAGEYEGIDNFYLALIGRTPEGEVEGSAFYVFDKGASELMINYDEESGEYSHRVGNPQWSIFKEFIASTLENLIMNGSHGVNHNLTFKLGKLESNLDVMKALMENSLVSGGVSTASGTSSTRSGFTSSRTRRRSSTTLNAADLDVDPLDVPDTDEDTVPFDQEDESLVKKTAKKTASKKIGTKSSKKSISVDDIVKDMSDDDLDNMEDLD